MQLVVGQCIAVFAVDRTERYAPGSINVCDVMPVHKKKREREREKHRDEYNRIQWKLLKQIISVNKEFSKLYAKEYALDISQETLGVRVDANCKPNKCVMCHVAQLLVPVRLHCFFVSSVCSALFICHGNFSCKFARGIIVTIATERIAAALPMAYNEANVYHRLLLLGIFSAMDAGNGSLCYLILKQHCR